MKGDLKGRAIAVPPGEIRPIMDKMRESLFSILGDLHGKAFLDLFAGSAVVGLEAYSRGAYPVTCVEKDRGKRSVLVQNLAGLDPPVRLQMEPVERFVVKNTRKWDIIYLDPPFPYRFRRDLLTKLSRSRGMEPETLVVIHVPSSDPLPDCIANLVVTDRRTFGGSLLYFLRFRGAGTETPRFGSIAG